MNLAIVTVIALVVASWQAAPLEGNGVAQRNRLLKELSVERTAPEAMAKVASNRLLSNDELRIAFAGGNDRLKQSCAGIAGEYREVESKPWLLAGLRDESATVVAAVITALTDIGHKFTDRERYSHLHSKQLPVRVAAVVAFAPFLEADTKEVVRLLCDPSAKVRATALANLTMLDIPQSDRSALQKCLTKLMRDSDEEVRSMWVYRIERLVWLDNYRVNYLKEVCAYDKSKDVRYEAASALYRLGMSDGATLRKTD